MKTQNCFYLLTLLILSLYATTIGGKHGVLDDNEWHPIKNIKDQPYINLLGEFSVYEYNRRSKSQFSTWKWWRPTPNPITEHITDSSWRLRIVQSPNYTKLFGWKGLGSFFGTLLHLLLYRINFKLKSVVACKVFRSGLFIEP